MSTKITLPNAQGERNMILNDHLSQVAGINAAGEPTLLKVEDDGSLALTGNFTVGSVDVTNVGIHDAVSERNVTISANGLNVDVKASALPTGAATQATLASMDGKMPSLGAAAKAASVPVNIASDQTVPVSAASLPLPTGAGTAANQASALTKLDQLHTDIVSNTSASIPAGTNIIGKVTIDQSTPGTTNLVQLAAGSAVIGQVLLPAIPAGTNTIGSIAPTPATLVSSSAYESGRVIKASPGTLISISGFNNGPSQFIQLHNSATNPANGAVPVKIVAVPAQSNFSIDVPLTGIPFSTGVAVCNSSTGPTKTLASADCFFTAVVI